MASAGEDESSKRPRFGTRTLTEGADVFQQNAWDHVEWTPEQEERARGIVEQHCKAFLPEEKREKLESEADSYWDKFYSQHENKFFKDRHWLFTEFPELLPEGHQPTPSASRAEDEGDGAEESGVRAKGEQQHKERVAPPPAPEGSADSEAAVAAERLSPEALLAMSAHATRRILEVGCGVGNTALPLLAVNRDPSFFVYACDFAPSAISLLRRHAQYEPQRCRAFVYDVTGDAPLPPSSLDVVILIFVLSAIHPDKMQAVVNNLAKCLKPGGLMLLRDYGRFDLAQLRFKKDRCISENFYMRGDGTRVYFFTQEELRSLLVNAGLEEQQNVADRRLLVNRGRQLTMQRVWIQCKYVKPMTSGPAESSNDATAAQ